MLSWLLNRKKEPGDVLEQAVEETEFASTSTSNAPLEPELHLVPFGTLRAEPVTAVEKRLSQEFQDVVSTCRAKFAEPGFDLPTLPSSALRTIELIQDPNVSTRRIAETIRLDLVLTAKFLRMANSALYAGSRRVDSLQHAIDRLGLATVRSMLLAASLRTTLIKEKRLSEKTVELWRHSIHTALAAQCLAGHLDLDPPTAFTLGLMHDIGKLPAWLMLHELCRKTGPLRSDLLDTWVEDSHAEMGRVLVEVWGLPTAISVTVAGHHIVSSTQDAAAFVSENALDHPDPEMLARLMSCVILADRSLAALGLAQEPGDLTIGDSCFATELGLSKEVLLEYLFGLTDLLAQNDFSGI